MARKIFGSPDGIPEGSDFTLESTFILNGITDTGRVTSSGTYSITVSDSILNGGTALLSALNGTFSTAVIAGGLATWTITDAQSSGWEAGTYGGDIKLSDSGSLLSYFPVTVIVRSPKN